MNPVQTDIQQKVKTIYISQDKITQIIEGFDEIPQQSLKDYYVKLQLVIKDDTKTSGTAYEDVSGEKKDISLADLFDTSPHETSSEEPKRLLILGGAGVGKSTLMQYIAYKWANNELWEGKFDYVYRISLKVLLNPDWKTSPWAYEPEELNESLLKCLAHYCLTLNLSSKERKEFQTDKLPWIGSTEAEVLLLLDGYDEVAHLQNSNNEFKRVIDEILEFDNVVLTSRPNAVKNNMKTNFDRIIESTGLDSQGVQEYFDRYFPKEHENKKQELQSFLSTRSVIREICKIPVNIAMLCYIWLYSDSSQSLKEISNVSALYQQMFDHLGFRYLQKKFQEKNPSKIYQLSEHFQGKFSLDEIKVLTHVAYKAITGGGITVESEKRAETLIIKSVHQENGNIHLQDKDSISLQSSINYLLENSQINNSLKDKVTVRQLYKYGLLKTEGIVSSSAKDSSDTDLLKLSFSFIHLTFQEFCTACYLKDRLQRGTDQEKRDICKFLAEQRNDPRYAMTLKFMVGIMTDDQGEGADLAIQLFWEALVCNVDGMIELGIEAKVGLLLSSLGEAVVKKENSSEIDPRIPKRQEIIDFVDAIVLNDILIFYNQLKDTSYLSENIKQGILQYLIQGNKEWHIQKMREITDKSRPAMRLAIENILKETEAASNKIQPEEQQTVHLERMMELAINFIDKITDKTSKEDYKITLFNTLIRAVQRLSKDFDKNMSSMQKVLIQLKTITLQMDIIKEDLEFKNLISILQPKLVTESSLSNSVCDLYCSFVARITKTEYSFECILALISELGSSKDENPGFDITLKHIEKVIAQESNKEVVTKLIEYSIASAKQSSCFVNSITKEVHKSLDNRELIIQRLKMLEEYMVSKDDQTKTQTIKVFTSLLNVPQEDLKLEYFSKLCLMINQIESNDIRKDTGKTALDKFSRFFCFSNSKEDTVIECLKRFLHFINHKSEILELHSSAFRHLLEVLFSIRKGQDELMSGRVLMPKFTASLEDKETSHELSGQEVDEPRTEGLEDWRAQVFKDINNIIDEEIVERKKMYEELSQNNPLNKEENVEEKAVRTPFDDAIDGLYGGDPKQIKKSMYSLDYIFCRLQNNKEKQLMASKALKHITPLVLSQDFDVTSCAITLSPYLSEIAKNSELALELIQTMLRWLPRGGHPERIIDSVCRIMKPYDNELFAKVFDLIEQYLKQISGEMPGDLFFTFAIFMDLQITDPDLASQVLQKYHSPEREIPKTQLLASGFISYLACCSKNHEIINDFCTEIMAQVENKDFELLSIICSLDRFPPDKYKKDDEENERQPLLKAFMMFSENEQAVQLVENTINHLLNNLDDEKFDCTEKNIINFMNFSKNKDLVAKVRETILEKGLLVDPSKISHVTMKTIKRMIDESNDLQWKISTLQKIARYIQAEDLNDKTRKIAVECLVLQGLDLVKEKELIFDIVENFMPLFADGKIKFDSEMMGHIIVFIYEAVNNYGSNDLIKKALRKLNQMTLENITSNKHSFSELNYGYLTGIISEFVIPTDIMMEFICNKNQKLRENFAYALGPPFRRLRSKLNNLRRFLRDKNLDVEIVSEKFFDNELEANLKEEIRLQINKLKENNTEEELNNLKSILGAQINKSGNLKGYELIELALKIVDFGYFNIEEPDQEDVVNTAKEMLELQMEYLSQEGLRWLNDNFERIAKLSTESKPFLKKLYHLILNDLEITPLEESLIIKIINLGLTTSISRKGEVIFEGKKYLIKCKNTEQLVEGIASTILSLEKDPLALQYSQHEPIFPKDIELGIVNASSDIKKVYSLLDKERELTKYCWLFTKLKSKQNQEQKLIIEQRNSLGDHVIYDISRQKLIQIHPLEIGKGREEIFGTYDPSNSFQYESYQKELDKKTGYEIISSGSEWNSKFMDILESGLTQKQSYFQKELLGKGYSNINSSLESDLNQKLQENRKILDYELQKLSFLNQAQKTKLAEYHKAFVSTFTEVYTTAQIIESGQVVVDAGSTPQIGLVSTLVTFIPVVGDKLSKGIDSMDKFMKSQAMINGARRMKLLATSAVELDQLVSQIAIAIIQDKIKQNQIINDVEDVKEENQLLEESLKGIMIDNLKQEILKIIKPNSYGEMYNTRAAKIGNQDATELIQKWISEAIIDTPSVGNRTESIKQQFVNVATSRDKPDSATKAESISCLNPCRGSCALF